MRTRGVWHGSVAAVSALVGVWVTSCSPSAAQTATPPSIERPASSAQERALTNADVIKLVRAGLSDTLVIATIRQSPRTAFDVSPEALIALKTAGVSDAVIAVMMTPRSSSEPAPPPAVVTAAAPPSMPTEASRLARYSPGIYLESGGGTDSPNLVPLEPAVFTQGKSGGVLASAMTFGIAKAKWKAVVRGARANIRTTIQQPTFYFIFENKTPGLSESGGLAGLLAGASSPNEFVLVQMFEKRDSREVIVGEFNAFGSSAGTRSEDTIPLRIQRLAPGIYRVTPDEPLGPGEFCFFYAATVPAASGVTAGKLFDFGVDPPDLSR